MCARLCSPPDPLADWLADSADSGGLWRTLADLADWRTRRWTWRTPGGLSGGLGGLAGGLGGLGGLWRTWRTLFGTVLRPHGGHSTPGLGFLLDSVGFRKPVCKPVCNMGRRVTTVVSCQSVSFLPHGAEGHNSSVSCCFFCHMGRRVRTGNSFAIRRQGRTSPVRTMCCSAGSHSSQCFISTTE